MFDLDFVCRRVFFVKKNSEFLPLNIIASETGSPLLVLSWGASRKYISQIGERGMLINAENGEGMGSTA